MKLGGQIWDVAPVASKARGHETLIIMSVQGLGNMGVEYLKHRTEVLADVSRLLNRLYQPICINAECQPWQDRKWCKGAESPPSSSVP